MSIDQKRLAAALSAAGLNDRQVGAEVLWMLPESFVTAYERVYLRAFGAAVTGTQRRDGEVQRAVVRRSSGRVSSGQPDHIGVGSAQMASGGSRVPVSDERAMRAKQRADRKLRALARELAGDVGSSGAQRRCAGRCKKWADAEWLYCPWCGGPTEDT